ncbi:sodium-coupled monocarboxylate transporter 2-like [Portunus trituberculatus]|uniref:sodium-coupled monocarboxylate transporter 2-like n=1 Tax=Portunus trituberculatus TaxID=210409 RepID=UPI001E1CCA6E|nr:sodium-coupled monocarboxylate transporter 2-like [Portunus trituberculatus]XP_045109490.1 sodium-coupled monocarboxylate transporter 2-like [Portunus trituberculatus]
MTDLTHLSDRFQWPDYLVFALMLVVSAVIGIIYGCFGKKQNTSEFLMAGKSMTTFPVAMSLIASFMSAITLLGTPSEVYQNGFIYWLIGFSYILVMPAAAYLYFPVFYKLQVTSAYEYLEMRFDKSVRLLGSSVFIVQMCLYMAIVVYAPALALAQVTGFNVYISVSLICFVCIFYTTLGGMKAVLWTDALQTVIMYASMMFVIIKGAIDVGGLQYVWQRNMEGGRATLIDFDPDPTTRHTFWTLIVGGYFTWITIYGVNQAQVQRYLSVQTRQMVTQALFINLVGLFILMITCAFGGMVVYAKYADCDPITSGIVKKGDQLFPLFVMDTLWEFRGLPGLFVAGIFSGALSTVSSGMNSLAAIVLEDYIKGTCMPNISDEASTWWSRGLSLFFGLLTFALVFVAEQLGDILSAALSIFGMVGGPLLGLFTLGMFFPWANKRGALVGGIVSLIFLFWIGIGFQVAKANGQIPSTALPISTDGCDLLNITIKATTTVATTIVTDTIVEEPGEPLGIFRLSYMWYSATGCFTVIVVGMIVSAITGLQDVKTLDPVLLSPGLLWVQRWIPGLDGLGENCNESETLNDIKVAPVSNGGTVNPGFETDLGEKKRSKNSYSPNEKETARL